MNIMLMVGTGKTHQDQGYEPSLDLATRESRKLRIRVVRRARAQSMRKSPKPRLAYILAQQIRRTTQGGFWPN